MRHILTALLFATVVHAQQPAAPKPKAYTDPAQTDEDFTIQGEYVGEIDGKTYGVQIWAQGGGKFEAVSRPGGLPGAGWDGDRATITRVSGARAAGEKSAVFATPDGSIKAEVNGANIWSRGANMVRCAPFSCLVASYRRSSHAPTPPPPSLSCTSDPHGGAGGPV